MGRLRRRRASATRPWSSAIGGLNPRVKAWASRVQRVCVVCARFAYVRCVRLCVAAASVCDIVPMCAPSGDVRRRASQASSSFVFTKPLTPGAKSVRGMYLLGP